MRRIEQKRRGEMVNIQILKRLGDLTEQYPEIERLLRLKIKLLGIPFGDNGRLVKRDVVVDVPHLLADAIHQYSLVDYNEIMGAPVVLRRYSEEEKITEAHPILSAWTFLNVYHRAYAVVFDFSPRGIIWKEQDQRVDQLVNDLYQAVLQAAIGRQPQAFLWETVGVNMASFEIIDGKAVMWKYVAGEYQHASQLLAVAKGKMRIENVSLCPHDLGLKWESIDSGA